MEAGIMDTAVVPRKRQISKSKAARTEDASRPPPERPARRRPTDGASEYDTLDRVLRAFQAHFRPSNWSGQPDVETAAILFALIEKYRPDALEENAELARVAVNGREPR